MKKLEYVPTSIQVLLKIHLFRPIYVYININIDIPFFIFAGGGCGGLGLDRVWVGTFLAVYIIV